MMEQIENRMVVDSEWGEIEYGVPNQAHISEQARYERALEQGFEFKED